MKYSTINLTDLHGYNKERGKGNITALGEDLDEDETLSIEEKYVQLKGLFTEVNVLFQQEHKAHKALHQKYTYLTHLILSEEEQSILKCKNWLFHGGMLRC